MVVTYYLLYPIIIFALLHIYFDYKKNYDLTYFLKPFTIILIIAFAVTKSLLSSGEYKIFIILGLFFSLIGDIFLMLKKHDFFIYGLISFLIAHLTYILASIFENDFQLNFTSFVISVLIFLLATRLIMTNVDKKKLPVIIYSTVIIFLLYQTLSSYITLNNFTSQVMFFGVLLFTISDFTLAYNKFVKKIRFGQIIILATYYAAQFFIASSV